MNEITVGGCMILNYRNQIVEAEVDYSGAACDAFIAAGYYVDTGVDLTETELDELNAKAQDKIAEYCMERSGYWKE